MTGPNIPKGWVVIALTGALSLALSPEAAYAFANAPTPQAKRGVLCDAALAHRALPFVGRGLTADSRVATSQAYLVAEQQKKQWQDNS
jgi:hypothetical protein